MVKRNEDIIYSNDKYQNIYISIIKRAKDDVVYGYIELYRLRDKIGRYKNVGFVQWRNLIKTYVRLIRDAIEYIYSDDMTYFVEINQHKFIYLTNEELKNERRIYEQKRC